MGLRGGARQSTGRQSSQKTLQRQDALCASTLIGRAGRRERCGGQPLLLGALKAFGHAIELRGRGLDRGFRAGLDAGEIGVETRNGVLQGARFGELRLKRWRQRHHCRADGKGADRTRYRADAGSDQNCRGKLGNFRQMQIARRRSERRKFCARLFAGFRKTAGTARGVIEARLCNHKRSNRHGIYSGRRLALLRHETRRFDGRHVAVGGGAEGTHDVFGRLGRTACLVRILARVHGDLPIDGFINR